jgi:hypothetical protein
MAPAATPIKGKMLQSFICSEDCRAVNVPSTQSCSINETSSVNRARTGRSLPAPPVARSPPHNWQAAASRGRERKIRPAHSFVHQRGRDCVSSRVWGNPSAVRDERELCRLAPSGTPSSPKAGRCIASSTAWVMGLSVVHRIRCRSWGIPSSIDSRFDQRRGVADRSSHRPASLHDPYTRLPRRRA